MKLYFYSTKSAHSAPTHATNKHTNSDGHLSEKHHHHHTHHQQDHHQPAHHVTDGKVNSEHGRGGTSEHRKSPVMVSVTSPPTITTTAQTAPKRKHSHGLYDQVKERSAKKQAAEHNLKPVTESSASLDTAVFTPPDLRESVSQLESTISKTIANNEQLKKDEETLLARKSKHKRIDIERIVETELLLPEIERLQDEVFRDDYVIEDVVRPKFYDFSTQPDGVGKFVPLEPEVEVGKPVTSTVSVSRPTVTSVKPVGMTVSKSTTTSSPIILTTTSTSIAQTAASEGTTSTFLPLSTVPMRQTDEVVTTKPKDSHPAITPVVSLIDADEDAPSRSDTTTTTIGTISTRTSFAPGTPHHHQLLAPTGVSSNSPTIEAHPATSTTSLTTALTGAKMVATESTTVPVTTTVSSTTSATTTSTTTASIITTEGTTNSIVSSASATNTRNSTNIVASVPLVKVSLTLLPHINTSTTPFDI
uniref:Uncharacterized protein n=1 Tax=Anopheles maculatus TaxID=74869 RepID=A0A182S9L2_9DIPT